MEKYFVCDRFRQALDIEYVKSFYKNGLTALYNSEKEAKSRKRVKFKHSEGYREYEWNEYFDDSDYAVIRVTDETKFEILR